MKNEIMVYESLIRDMSGWASEYVLSLSKMVVGGEWVWHVLMCEDKVDVKLSECYEIVGRTVEELRMNFLIRLAELRKEKLDKVK